MALLSPQAQYQIRQTNKEPDWSSICNNVFDQYLDTNDLFGFDPDHHERNSSNDSLNLFDFSGSSEQSHDTEATSPLHAWELPVQPSVDGARQPQAKEPLNFWAKTLRALEQNAAESERHERTLRSTKSHPDFLSLGGHPSPPAVPSSPTEQLTFVQQRLPRSAVVEKRRNITARSLSRGRPTGVTKPVVAGSVNPYATVRKRSASPSKMMTPSRYRAGFKDLWLENAEISSRRCEPRRAPSPLFCTPPPSANLLYDDDFTAFGSNSGEPAKSVFDEHVSPLTTTFQQTHINTPIASPAVINYTHLDASFLEPMPPRPSNSYVTQATALNDTAPLYAERRTSLAASQIQSFDFGFSNATNDGIWPTSDGNAQTREPIHSIDPFSDPDPFVGLHARVLPTTETLDLNTVGLGISCDPSLVSNIPPMGDTAVWPTTVWPTTMYQPTPVETIPYYLTSRPNGIPNTPHHRRTRSCRRSESPSPPATEPRSSRKASSSRRASRHRRTKSTNSTARNPQNTEKGAFVNFTADDSNKILSGVAPSGSSKTKARREKEAADKRRRFSQAAVRAVVEAGGDLDALSKAGLLV